MSAAMMTMLKSFGFDPLQMKADMEETIGGAVSEVREEFAKFHAKLDKISARIDGIENHLMTGAEGPYCPPGLLEQYTAGPHEDEAELIEQQTEKAA